MCWLVPLGLVAIVAIIQAILEVRKDDQRFATVCLCTAFIAVIAFYLLLTEIL